MRRPTGRSTLERDLAEPRADLAARDLGEHELRVVVDVAARAWAGDHAREVERDQRAAKREQGSPQCGLDVVERGCGRAARDRERLFERVLDVAIAGVDTGRHGAPMRKVFTVWRPDISRKRAPCFNSDLVSDRNCSRFSAVPSTARMAETLFSNQSRPARSHFTKREP